jgi:hypothetical protein
MHVPAQRLLHSPQLLLSVFVSMHFSPQSVSPFVHVTMDVMQLPF